MEKNVQETLQAAGVDVEGGLRRVSGSELLYVKLLAKFLQDKSYDRFQESIENKELSEAADAVHALKGVSANLGMDKLYEQCLLAEKQLKANELPQNVAELRQSMDEVKKAIATL